MRLRFVGGFLEKAGEEVADFLREFRVAGFGKQRNRSVRFGRTRSVRLRVVSGFLEKAGEEVADFLRGFRVAGFGKQRSRCV